MTVALLFILLLATPFAAADRAVAGHSDEALMAAAPLALLALFAILSSPSPLRIYDDAIELSRSRLARRLGKSKRLPLADAVNIFPTSYEDAGMRFSPFASAEGTAKHAGIGIEMVSGERFVVPFTPAVLNLRRHGTPAYDDALLAIRQARDKLGMPMVTKPPSYTQEQVDQMLREASRPLLAFPITVAGIFAPALLIPLLITLARRANPNLPEWAALTLVLVGLLPLLAVFGFVNLKSRRRAKLLHEVQKHRAHERERRTRASNPSSTAD
jgi:hypothetical protein